MPKNHVFGMKFARVYPLYVQKAERKNRTKEEVDQIICWLTGYDDAGLRRQIEQENDLETFFAQSPRIHPNTALIKGAVCGVRVEEVEDPLMRKIRYLDKLIDAGKRKNDGEDSAAMTGCVALLASLRLSPFALIPHFWVVSSGRLLVA
jgi:hypothetical protein